MGRYWGLRRLADDGGRFMLLDLRALEGDALADVVTGLAPYATGVVLQGDAALAAWRRFGSAAVGRVDVVETEAGLRAARETGADAVLAPAALSEAAAAIGLARLGADPVADLTIGGGLVIAADDEAVIVPGVAGYLTAASLLDPVRATADAPARKLLIADALVPLVQRLNARVADLPEGAWLDD